jgi:hypothetical protein
VFGTRGVSLPDREGITAFLRNQNCESQEVIFERGMLEYDAESLYNILLKRFFHDLTDGYTEAFKVGPYIIKVICVCLDKIDSEEGS